ncbi:ATP-dependent DNA ligase [Streptomyces bambusae]|uniref:ATP-dependent DNA ligase n=1 Tax=Streptomyces bambusae TaxID=1550616 RepID=UPI001CFE5084|nr:ATP-dependent DNA ligase [Streptomyces bambusae]MCB5165445.1 ATP-dependent DNA ligase [Streptomyces bambusae]
MLIGDVARVSREVADTAGRGGKVSALARLFGGAPVEEAGLVVAYLAGELPQGRLGVGRRLLAEPVPASDEPVLTVTAVDAALTDLAAESGPGSQARRRHVLTALLGRATAPEQEFLIRLISGEVRQGALAALALEGVAEAAGVPAGDLRRAVMHAGALPPVAEAVLAGGPAALAAFTVTVGRPVQPMLAHTAKSVTEALTALGPCSVEEKLDGIRVQVHRTAGTVRAYTRSLAEITDRLPEVAALARTLPGGDFILDGEAIALDAEGRPVAFQDVAGRVGSRLDVAAAQAALPLSPAFFDVLVADGQELLDLPLRERHALLDRLVPPSARVRRLAVSDPAADAGAAEAFWAAALARGHEGVVVKALESPYSAGRRGRHWLKVKPVHTLDLVVLAAERGHGRRTGFLSNLHLGARTADGGFVMLGKTFKGLTDAVLRDQTARLTALAVSDDGFTVRVRPELVVEIAYDGLQRSPRYPAGVTLRFARVVRYRPDKTAAEADTVETVLASA